MQVFETTRIMLFVFIGFLQTQKWQAELAGNSVAKGSVGGPTLSKSRSDGSSRVFANHSAHALLLI